MTTQETTKPAPPAIEKIKVKVDGREVEVPKLTPDWQGKLAPTTMLQACDIAKQDAEYLGKIADNIPGGKTICAFGEACSWPVQSFVAKFKDEFVAKGAADEERRAKENPSASPRLCGELKEFSL